MDAFFASVEQRDNPELRGKPIAVGFDGPRGVVSTASYEARPFGVRSAMSMAQAKRRCPQLIVVSSHFDRYKEVSRQIHAVFHEYTDLVEPISLDEAFLDVSENKKGIELAVDIAKEIKQKIFERTSLTASAGISYNKLLAKIASDMRKPNGIFTLCRCLVRWVMSTMISHVALTIVQSSLPMSVSLWAVNALFLKIYISNRRLSSNSITSL